MTKTPEQMAEEYAFKFYLNEDSGYAMTMNRDAFLAGYQAAINSPKNSDSSDDSDTPDLQEQVEALQQYMAVAEYAREVSSSSLFGSCRLELGGLVGNTCR